MTALCVSSNSNFFYEILQFSAQPISAGIEPFLNIFSSEIVFFLLTSYFFIYLLLCFSFMFLLLLRTRSFDLICVSVGRLVASSTRRPQFASSHRQNLYWTFFKMAIPGLFFFIFVFSIQLTVHTQYKVLPMTGFELQTSGIGSDRSTIWATTICLLSTVLKRRKRGRDRPIKRFATD